MGLEQKIMTELKTAMLAKDEAGLRSLRAIKAAILLVKTAEGGGGELKEEDEVKLLQKLVKQRKDSLEIFQQQNRADLAKKEEEEIAVIEKFLPKQLSADELILRADYYDAAWGDIFEVTTSLATRPVSEIPADLPDAVKSRLA